MDGSIPSLMPSSKSCLADIILPNWKRGQPTAPDVIVISTLQWLTQQLYHRVMLWWWVRRVRWLFPLVVGASRLLTLSQYWPFCRPDTWHSSIRVHLPPLSEMCHLPMERSYYSLASPPPSPTAKRSWHLMTLKCSKNFTVFVVAAPCNKIAIPQYIL